MKPIPASLLAGPFTRETAAAAGVTDRMLQGGRFVRLFPRVWRHREHEMTAADWREAAALCLPERARLTGISRLQALGLDHGPLLPLHFVIEGDHHLAPDGIFLHRTRGLAPVDIVGIAPTGAYLSYLAGCRTVDAIRVGDWLLATGTVTVDDVRTLALAAPWRAGADEACWVLEHLDARSRSFPESETRAVLTFAGLPAPEVNVPVEVEPDALAIGDLVYRRWRTVVEYEGAHHQLDRGTYVADLDRYALFRAADQSYVQVTAEKLRHARTLVGEVYRTLVARGYAGPPPEFGEQWRLLFARLSDAVGPRPPRSRQR